MRPANPVRHRLFGNANQLSGLQTGHRRAAGAAFRHPAANRRFQRSRTSGEMFWSSPHRWLFLPDSSPPAGLVTRNYKRGHLPAGLVGLWSGENGGNDSVGGNKATLTDIAFAEGKVGRAFVFNGETSQITVPASKSLAVSNLTLAAWIFPTDLNSLRPIIDYGGARRTANIQLWINTTGGISVNPGGLRGRPQRERRRA